MRNDRGSGGILALAVLALIAVMALAVAGMGVGLATQQRVIAAADAGALAAADTALGIHPGVPCLVAAEVAGAHAVTLTACRVDGVVATVTASASFAGIPIEATARAGPPR